MSGDHYFTTEPAAPARATTVEFSAFGREFSLAAAGGVFSAQRLDPGTAVLLRKAPRPGTRGGVYLDLGCGYGPIAVSLAGTSPAATVYAVDVNVRALALVRDNAARSDLAAQVHPCTPDQVPPDLVFDEIWSNPPIRIGKPELHALLSRWLPRLAPDGIARLVVGQHLGSDSLQAWLVTQGWQVQRQASQKGYRVFAVTRPAAD